MSLFAPIKDHHSEKRLFVTRVILASVISLLLLSIVIARLVQLQVFDHELFAEQSQGNRIRIEAVPPTRGLIFDRRGRVLAENLPADQLELIPEQVPDLDDTLSRLARIGLIKEEDIPRFKGLSQSGPRFKPITLRFRLSDDEIANFAVQRPRFPGVDLQPRLVRHYPDGELIAHAIGYVGALSTADLQRLDEAAYAGTSHTGKTGVEHFNEELLHGDVGFRQVVTNALGRQVPVETRDYADAGPERESPVPGANLYLSLDLDLQRVAAEQMEGKRGAVVAIDPRNGEILALFSAPSFDPNSFATGESIDLECRFWIPPCSGVLQKGLLEALQANIEGSFEGLGSGLPVADATEKVGHAIETIAIARQKMMDQRPGHGVEAARLLRVMGGFAREDPLE